MEAASEVPHAEEENSPGTPPMMTFQERIAPERHRHRHRNGDGDGDGEGEGEGHSPGWADGGRDRAGETLPVPGTIRGRDHMAQLSRIPSATQGSNATASPNFKGEFEFIWPPATFP